MTSKTHWRLSQSSAGKKDQTGTIYSTVIRDYSKDAAFTRALKEDRRSTQLLVNAFTDGKGQNWFEAEAPSCKTNTGFPKWQKPSSIRY